MRAIFALDEGMVKLADSDPIEQFTRLISGRIIAGLSRTLNEQQLSVPQVAALFLLAERPSLKLSDVAAAVGLSLSAASRMVDGLVKAGLVERREAPDDRRQRLLAPTAAGARTVERAAAERMRAVHEVAAELGVQLVRALGALARKRPR
jgi:DNA-binding MarR family transcriptional regulator